MPQDPLSRTLAALADPTRRALLARLRQGTATVGELAEPFDLSLQAVSKHLKVLERAELIERGREAQWRPCTLRPERLREASDWIDRFRDQWEANFHGLDALLDDLKPETPEERPPAPRRRKKR